MQAQPAGADDGTRTRYLHHGKVALYQMSYIRIRLDSSFSIYQPHADVKRVCPVPI